MLSPPDSERRTAPTDLPQRVRQTFALVHTSWEWLGRGRRVAEQRQQLARHPLFQSCPSNELRMLLRWGDVLDVPAGVTLLRQHSRGSSMLAVLDGALRLDADQQPSLTIGPGAWTGEVAVLGFGPERHTVTTQENSRLFALGPRPLLSFAHEMDGLRAALFPGLTDREASDRIRALRAEGLARWRTLHATGPQAPKPDAYLRLYSVNRRARDATPGVTALLRAPLASSPPTRSERSPLIPLIAAGAVVLTIAIAAFVLRLPYYTSRGGVRSATNAVHIDGVDPPAGRILFPIVQIEQDTVIALLGDWGDDDADIRSSDQLLQGADVHELARANLRLMVESKRTAADVAAAVSGARFAPDVVRIDTGPIGGPSGGLAFALAILDMLSGGRLSAGRTICATGALARDGAVSVVGGITLKTGAAERAGCVFLLVPSANYDEASAASDEMPVVPIASLADAIAAVTSTSGTVDDATELRCHAQGLGSVIYPSRECARAT